MIKIRQVNNSDRDWIEEIVQSWGGSFVVSKGRKSYPQKSPGFIAIDSYGQRIGLLSYELRPGNRAEITLLEAVEEGKGAGRALVKAAIKEFKKAGLREVFVCSTNNNYDAFKFYQYQGFRPVAVYPDAMTAARKLKPSIPRICSNGLPINDEIEYCLKLSGKTQKKPK